MSSLTIHMKHISQGEHNQKEIDDCQPKSNWVRDEKWESMLQHIEWSEDELMITIIYTFLLYLSKMGNLASLMWRIWGNWEGGKATKVMKFHSHYIKNVFKNIVENETRDLILCSIFNGISSFIVF